MKYEIKITQEQYPGFGPQTISFTPKDTEWDELISCLKAVQADQWTRKYVDIDILDGSAIDLVARSQDLKVWTHCYNAFPKGFDEFWDVLEKVIAASGRDWSSDRN